MLRLLADENFNGDVVRALLLRQPDLDVVRVQDVGLAGIADLRILAWAAVNDRIILTHDVRPCLIMRLNGERLDIYGSSIFVRA